MIIQYQLVWRWVSSNDPEEDSLKYCCGLNRQMEAAGTHYAVVRMDLAVPKKSLMVHSTTPLPRNV